MMTASVLLINTKYPHNVGAALRAGSCFGAENVWYTGSRVPYEGTRKEVRIPREERMSALKDTGFGHVMGDRPVDVVSGDLVPVCVELGGSPQILPFFDHPENALYVFGPEDGSVPQGVRRACHLFVMIPTLHCTNLAAAVYITLYDRMFKRQMMGLDPTMPSYATLAEDRHG